MKKLLFFIAASAAAVPAMAQNETDLLQNYKYRFQRYRSFNFYLNAGESGGVGIFNFGKSPGSANTSSNYNSGLSAGLNRYYITNTDRRQVITNLGLYHNSEFSGQSSFYSNGVWYSSIGYNREARTYISEKKFWFLNTDFSAGDYHTSRELKTAYPVFTEPRKRYNDNASIGISVSAGMGKGRLEYVSDMSFALFWLKDMQQKGVIGDYTEADASQIAKSITQMRNTRILDFRFNTIGQLKMMDSAFRNSKLLKSDGADYYTTLYDHYLYANNYVRFHGKRWDYGVTLNPSYTYYYQFEIRDTLPEHFSSSQISQRALLSAFVRRTVNIAQSLKNQFNYNYGFMAGFEDNSNDELRFDSAYFATSYGWQRITGRLDANLQWQRFWNTRNSTTWSVNGAYEFGKSPEYDPVQHEFFVGAEVRHYHWFSPNLNIFAGASYSQQYYRVYNTPKDWYQGTQLYRNINLGLNYTLY